jgi:hypothetical protein
MLKKNDVNSMTLDNGETSSTQEIPEILQPSDGLGNGALDLPRLGDSGKKTEDIRGLRLIAKLDRALGHRMSDQDATFGKKASRLSTNDKKHMVVVSKQSAV